MSSLNVVLDADPHGYTQRRDEDVHNTYYWHTKDGELTWRKVENDEVPADVRERTRDVAETRGWIDE